MVLPKMDSEELPYDGYDVVVCTGNPGVVDAMEWKVWGDPSLSIVEKTMKIDELRRFGVRPSDDRLRLEPSAISLREALAAENEEGHLLARVGLFDYPRLFKENDFLELFDSKRRELPRGTVGKVHREGLRSGELYGFDSLRKDIRGEYLDILAGLNAEHRTSHSLSDVLFLPIVRARREFIRLLNGQGDRPCIGEIDDILLKSAYTVVSTHGDVKGKVKNGTSRSNYGVSCLGALAATNWFLHDLGKRKQKERGLPDRPVLVRGFWEVDEMRLRSEDLGGAAEIAVDHLGVDAVENIIFRADRRTYGGSGGNFSLDNPVA